MKCLYVHIIYWKKILCATCCDFSKNNLSKKVILKLGVSQER